MNDELISEYRVMRSAAGWYVGQGYREAEWGDDGMYFLPYDRCTGYYETEEQALDMLKQMLYAWSSDDNEYILTRLYFEDRVSFWHNLDNFS
jgi:hypothetical protein